MRARSRRTSRRSSRSSFPTSPSASRRTERMPSLKELRGRITSVKSTRKITSAMKMVAASKLRRAQAHAEAARPYAEAMQRMLAALARNVAGREGAPRLLAGTGKDQVHLVVPITSDRGLAGGFNANIGRAARNLVRRLESE